MEKIIDVNIEHFLEHFNAFCEYLYNNNDNVNGFKEAVEIGNNFIESNPEFLGQFVKYRGDFISSDREVAAFAFTLCKYI